MLRRKDSEEMNLVGIYAGLLSLTETGIGSILHAFHVPFTGHFLSLNQIFILSRASSEGAKKLACSSPFLTSFIAAMLKALSPMGKKLTPMLAISVQGLLYTVGIFIFGHSFIGRLTGALLASLWAFVQPLLLYYLIFGRSLFDAILGLVKDISEYFALNPSDIAYAIISLIILKVFAAIALVAAVSFFPSTWFDAYIEKVSQANLNHLQTQKHDKPSCDAVKGALQDICRPLFLFALFITGLFFYWADGDYTVVLLQVLRPLAIGFTFFYLIRLLPVESIVGWFEAKQTHKITAPLRIALKKLGVLP